MMRELKESQKLILFFTKMKVFRIWRDLIFNMYMHYIYVVVNVVHINIYGTYIISFVGFQWLFDVFFSASVWTKIPGSLMNLHRALLDFCFLKSFVVFKVMLLVFAVQNWLANLLQERVDEYDEASKRNTSCNFCFPRRHVLGLTFVGSEEKSETVFLSSPEWPYILWMVFDIWMCTV